MAEEPRLTDAGIDISNDNLVSIEDYREAEWGEIVAETDSVIVFADHKGHELNEWAEALDMPRDDLSRTMHREARKHTDYNWSASDPVVVLKED